MLSPSGLTRHRRFADLMRQRVRDVLLVSSLYDAYILQEDGHLTEQVYLEYRQLQLSSAPRFSHAADPEGALAALRDRRFDMVLIANRTRQFDEASLAEQIKAQHPDVSVVLLAFDSSDFERLRALYEVPAIDGIFSWSGDAKVLLVASKYAEDTRNVDADVEAGNIRVILVVEDSIRYYSAFLSVLYPELMLQSQSLFAEGLNRLQKLLRMRARPKVLLARSYEDALTLYDRYRDNLLSVISDVGYPRGGELDPTAGLALARRIRAECPDLPVLLQSAEPQYEQEADALRVQFVNKNDPTLLHHIRRFLREYLGFGPFIFRTPDGTEVARAENIVELADRLADVPADAVEYHARHNHFSSWLLARSEFDLAALMRPQGVEDYANVEDLRQATVSEIRSHNRALRAGVIADYSPRGVQAGSQLQRVGSGSMGGKARGIAFLDQLLTERPDLVSFPDIEVRVPQAVVLATNAFDRFLQENHLYAVASADEEDEWIARRFQEATLPDDVREALRSFVANVDYPLAVRSSSLLEDDMLLPFAGVYGTVVLGNRHARPADRLSELERAVRYVYASTFFRRTKSYLERAGRRLEEEKMGVLIQQLVGRQQGEHFYPYCTGVADSYNFYALDPQQPEDGAVQLVFGLSPITTAGEGRLRFSPADPMRLPQYPSPTAQARFAQRSFLALRPDASVPLRGARPPQILERLDLTQATPDLPLSWALGRYVPGSGTIRHDPAGPGERIITFRGLRAQEGPPLLPALRALLSLASAGVGMAVEIEFALDLHGPTKASGPATLYPLQLRPMVKSHARDLDAPTPASTDGVLQSPSALGTTPATPVSDVVYVRRAAYWQGADPMRLAREIETVNRALVNLGRPYVLIGPGRWGDTKLGGLPVTWAQIDGVGILVEIWPPHSEEPPAGAHFFDTLAAQTIPYITIAADHAVEPDPSRPYVHWAWLAAQPAIRETGVLRWVRLETPLCARINDPHPGALLVPSASWDD